MPVSGESHRPGRIWLFAFHLTILSLAGLSFYFLHGGCVMMENAVAVAFPNVPPPTMTTSVFEHRDAFLWMPLPWCLYAIYSVVRRSGSAHALIFHSASLLFVLVTVGLWVALIFCLPWFPRNLSATPPDLIPLDEVREGVYSLSENELLTVMQQRNATYVQTTILELKDGRFRYWFRSNAGEVGEPLEYPQSGTYVAEGGVVKMDIKIARVALQPGEPAHDFSKPKGWKCMTYGKRTILWPEDSPAPRRSQRIPAEGVLVRTDRTPDEIWNQEAPTPGRNR